MAKEGRAGAPLRAVWRVPVGGQARGGGNAGSRAGPRGRDALTSSGRAPRSARDVASASLGATATALQWASVAQPAGGTHRCPPAGVAS